MKKIDKELATKIIDRAISKARELNINPIMVVILDHTGSVKACMAEDGTSPLRFKIAFGKANGAFPHVTCSCYYGIYGWITISCWRLCSPNNRY